MLWFSVGLPGHFAEWCDRVTVMAVERRFGAAEFVAANSLEDVARAAIRSTGPNLVVGSRQPTERLRTALAEAGTPFVLALGDPRAIVADLMLLHQFDLATAVRAVANSYCAILRYARLPGALIVRSTDRRDDAGSIVAAIARHLGHGEELPPEALEAGTAWPERPPVDFDGWWQSLGSEGQAVVDGALEGFTHYLTSGTLGSFRWDQRLFLLGDAAGTPVPQAIDITGRPRCLLYGPYLQLPPGAWIATVTLGCSAHAVGMPFVIEAAAGVPLAQTRLQPDAAGVFEAMLAFRIEEDSAAADCPVEVRLFTERSAFDGRIAVGSVAVTPQTTASPQVRVALGEAVGLATTQ